MRVNCQLDVTVDYRGFLTMYEDVSGFGAWHRRWCHLRNDVINFWLYPDDEKKKAPMGTIELKACATQRVLSAPRDMCARLNTILLEFRRPYQESDCESLTMSIAKDSKGHKITTIRYENSLKINEKILIINSFIDVSYQLTLKKKKKIGVIN